MQIRFFATLLWCCIAGVVCAQASVVEAAYADKIDRHRRAYKADFLTDKRSPLKAADTSSLDFYPADLSYLVKAVFTRTPEAEPFDLPTYSGITRRYVQYGVLLFELQGRPLTLNIYQNLKLVQDSAYQDYLFLPFKDQTNGGPTYGGGRYLDFRTGDIQNGVMMLDFNKAYNPWCAYSDGYNCPIPPLPNHLPVEIAAGERLFLGEKKH